MSNKPPEILDKLVDLVLAYKPKPKSEPGKKRKKLAKKLTARSNGPPKGASTNTPPKQSR